MDPLDQAARSEEVGLSRAWCRASYVSARDCPVGAEDNGASGSGLPVGEVADPNAFHVGQAVMQRPAPQYKTPSPFQEKAFQIVLGHVLAVVVSWIPAAPTLECSSGYTDADSSVCFASYLKVGQLSIGDAARGRRLRLGRQGYGGVTNFGTK